MTLPLENFVGEHNKISKSKEAASLNYRNLVFLKNPHSSLFFYIYYCSLSVVALKLRRFVYRGTYCHGSTVHYVHTSTTQVITTRLLVNSYSNKIS